VSLGEKKNPLLEASKEQWGCHPENDGCGTKKVSDIWSLEGHQMDSGREVGMGKLPKFVGQGAALGLFLVVVCFRAATGAETTVPLLKVKRTIPHTGYSEGLDYRDGYLWHALPKQILKIDPADGSVLERFTPPTDYSESLCWWGNEMMNLSFSDDSIHAGKLQDGKMVFTKRGRVPEVHGWGITHDDRHWIVTGDYSSKLYFLDRKSLEVKRTLDTEVTALEDLAWDGKWIWTSSFTQRPGQIFKIDPKTGKVGGYYRLSEKDECPIIDGIAWDGKLFWVTGKNCVSIYAVEKPK
jgi:glutamine cyclotransferase